MKKTTLFAFAAGVCLSAAVFLFGAFKQKDETPSYVTLAAFEFSGGVGESKIVIIYENGTTEEVPLETLTKTKTFVANAIKIHENINMLTHKGYRLVSSVSKGANTSYTFEKR